MNRLAKFIHSLVVLCILASPLTVLAQTPPASSPGVGLNFSFSKVNEIRDTAGVRNYGDNLSLFIFTVLKVILGLIATLAAAAIIYAGILLVTDLGNEEGVEKAKKIILYAVIGLILIGFSVVIVNVVINEFILKPTGTP